MAWFHPCGSRHPTNLLTLTLPTFPAADDEVADGAPNPMVVVPAVDAAEVEGAPKPMVARLKDEDKFHGLE